MKNYNEMAKDVLRRVNERNTVRERKRKTFLKAVISLCCVCLAVLGGVGIWQSGLFNTEPPKTLDDSINIGEKDYIEPGELGLTGNQNLWDLTLNNVSKQTSGARLYFDPELYYEENWTYDRAREYLNVDFASFADNLGGYAYTGAESFNVVFSNNGTIAYDIICFGFNGNGDTVSSDKHITIKTSKTGHPFDCCYVLETDKKTDIKMNDELTVSVLAGKTADGTFFADFEFKDIYFRVEAENLTLEEFGACLETVIKTAM